MSLNDIIRSIPRKNIMHLRGIIVKALIYPWTCEDYDTFLCESINDIFITIKHNHFYCEICKRKLKTYKAVFYHILNSHPDIVDSILFTYILKKYKFWGLI